MGKSISDFSARRPRCSGDRRPVRGASYSFRRAKLQDMQRITFDSAAQHVSYQAVKVYSFFVWRNSPTWARAASLLMFLDHTQLEAHTLDRASLSAWSAHRRARYLLNKHNRRTSILSGGFEPAIPAIERPQRARHRNPLDFLFFCEYVTFCIRSVKNLKLKEKSTVSYYYYYYYYYFNIAEDRLNCMQCF